MSEEQLSSLLAMLKEDAGLQDKFKGASGLDAIVEIAKDAGFDVSKADFLKYHAKQALELSDADLEKVAGGFDWVKELCLCSCISGGILSKDLSLLCP
jgi:predicted ribosomally synthesized peptide with nif11-like leader